MSECVQCQISMSFFPFLIIYSGAALHWGDRIGEMWGFIFWNGEVNEWRLCRRVCAEPGSGISFLFLSRRFSPGCKQAAACIKAWRGGTEQRGFLSIQLLQRWDGGEHRNTRFLSLFEEEEDSLTSLDLLLKTRFPVLTAAVIFLFFFIYGFAISVKRDFRNFLVTFVPSNSDAHMIDI